MKLQKLPPRLKMLDTANPRGLKMAHELKRNPPLPALLRKANATGRDADPRRTLKLNGSAWQKLRAHVLAGEPLCRQCTSEGHTKAATDVDHHDGDPSNNSLANLAPLCHECHSRKTAMDHGKKVRAACDANGWPSDPWHAWNEGTRADLASPGAIDAPEIHSAVSP
jgi:hypothetical protein